MITEHLCLFENHDFFHFLNFLRAPLPSISAPIADRYIQFFSNVQLILVIAGRQLISRFLAARR